MKKIVYLGFLGISLGIGSSFGALISPLTLETKVASTNRTKVGWEGFTTCGSIGKRYLSRTEVVSHDSHSEDSNCGDTTDFSYSRGGTSKTQQYNLNTVTYGSTVNGCPSASASAGTTSCSGWYISASWQDVSGSITNYSACTNAWNSSCEWTNTSGCSSFWINGTVSTQTPNDTQQITTEIYTNITPTCEEQINDPNPPAEPHFTSVRVTNITTVTLGSEFTADAVLDLAGASYPTNWGAGGQASVWLSANELCGRSAKLQYRLKFIAEKDKPYEFTYHEVISTAVTNIITEVKVSGVGTGTIQYYPSQSGKEIAAPKVAPIDGYPSSCASYMEATAYVDTGCKGSGFEHTGGGHGSGGPSCGSACKRPPGGSTAENGSVNIQMSLGNGYFGSDHGLLMVYCASPDATNSTPAGLDYFGTLRDVQVLHSNAWVRQVKAQQAFADIVTINANKYEVRFYSSSGSIGTSGFYESPSGLFATATIEHIGGDPNHLRFTMNHDTVSIHDYEWSTADQGWTLTSGGGLRKVTKAWNSTTLVETNTVRQGTTVVARTISHFQNVTSLGLILTQQVVVANADGTGLTNKWFYYDNAVSDGTNFGKLKWEISPSGFWKHYQYDTNTADLIREIHQFGNAATNAATNLCRVFEYDYSLVGNAREVKRATEHLLGLPISRSYELEYFNRNVFVQCQSPDAVWNDSSNLTTDTRLYTMGSFDQEIYSISNPDGTMEFYSYQTNDTTKLTVRYSGEPVSALTSIKNGTKTITLKDSVGNMISNIVRRVNSEVEGITISQETYSNPDEFGHPQTVTYLNGTSVTTLTGCCGNQSTTDNDGTTTTFDYDDLKRLLTSTRSDITISNVYDAADRILSRVRIGTDNSSIVLGSSTYDLAGRVIVATDAMNNSTTNGYGFDGSGQAVSTNIYADGGTRIETRRQDGLLLSVIGTAVHPARYEYGVEYAGTNSQGLSMTNFYVKEIKLETNGVDTAEWAKTYSDGLGRQWKTVYANGGIEEQFHNKGQLRGHSDPDGVITLYVHNPEGEREITVIDMDRDRLVDTNGTDRITQQTIDYLSARGTEVRRTRTYVWGTNSSPDKLLVSTSEGELPGTRFWVAGLSGMSSGRVDRDLLGGRTLTQTNVDQSYTVTVYQDGRMASARRYDANNVELTETTYAYDEHGRQETSTDERNGATSFTFSNADQITSITTPVPGTGQSALVTSNLYNNMGRIWKVIQPDLTSVTNEFYVTGLLKRTSGSRTYPVEYTHDSQGRMKTMKTWQNFASGSGAATTTWNYDDERGFLESKTYQGGVTVNYTNSLAGRLTDRRWARGIVTTYGYNNAGDVETINYSDSTPDVSYTYDRRGRKVAVAQSGGSASTLTYNDGGKLIVESFTAGPLNGVAITNIHDQFLRRTNITAHYISTRLLQHSYAYDNASRLALVSDGTNSGTYAYLDDSMLVETITFAQNGTNRMVTTKSYDYLNRLTNIATVNAAMATLSSHGYRYNTASQRTRATLADGAYWVYQYDGLGQVTSGKKYWADNTPVAGQQFEYTFDDIGNRKTAGSGGDQWGANLRYQNHSANLVNQYSQRTVPGFVDVLGSANTNATVTVNNQSTYRKGEYFRDELPVSNASSSVYLALTNLAILPDSSNPDITTNHNGNIFVPATPEIFGYDPDGNLTNDGRWAFSWDAENRLLSMVALSSIPSEAKLKLDFDYDHQWRRLQKIVSTNNAGTYIAHATNRFVHDGWNLLAVLDSQSRIVRNFMWGADLSTSIRGAGGVGGLLAVSDQQSSDFVCHDGNGNVVTLVRATNGSTSGQYEYGPFGEVIRCTADRADANPFRFSTRYTDTETELLYYGYRFYKPTTGRWLSRDPIAFNSRHMSARWIRETMNPYHAMFNDPVSRFDKLGLAANDVHRVSFDVKQLKCARNCGPDVTESIQSEFKALAKYIDDAPEMPLQPGNAAAANQAQLLVWFAKLVGPLNYARQIQEREAGLGPMMSGCPTAPCSDTMTLCGKCVTSDVPGNIMFAYAGRRLMGDWTANIGAAAAEVKDSFIGSKTDTELFEEDYDVFPLGRDLADKNSTDICTVLNRLPKRKVSDCKPCSEKFPLVTAERPDHYPIYTEGTRTFE
jgi:RHS repeat-associated protein